MFCDRCGAYAIRRQQLHDGIGDFACDACQRRFSRRVMPLYIVTGASGVGKTSITPLLQGLLPNCGVFDKDQMWARDWDMIYNNYFRIASALAQGGKVTVVVGTIMPEFLVGLSDRDLVGEIRYANLHCDDETRRHRLLTRRTWDVPDEEFIHQHEEFARWLLDHATTDFGAPMPTFDTTVDMPEVVAQNVATWVKQHVAGLCNHEGCTTGVSG
jgi:hypothetical protein